MTAKKKLETKHSPPPEPAAIHRRFGRRTIYCEGMLGFPGRKAKPRAKVLLFQIGEKGCGLYTQEQLFIGEECLLWAISGGHKYLGIPGNIVWQKVIYQGEKTFVVGIEFRDKLDLTPELLLTLGEKK